MATVIQNGRFMRANGSVSKTKEINHKIDEEYNNSVSSGTSTSILVSQTGNNAYIWEYSSTTVDEIINLSLSFLFPLFSKLTYSKDDSLAAKMENQDNDDGIDPIAQHHSDNGEPPHFLHKDDLPTFIHRPSGNMVKIKCQVAGKL